MCLVKKNKDIAMSHFSCAERRGGWRRKRRTDERRT
jgi:hypothetical protein